LQQPQQLRPSPQLLHRKITRQQHAIQRRVGLFDAQCPALLAEPVLPVRSWRGGHGVTLPH
jgi:hypothetical protein